MSGTAIDCKIDIAGSDKAVNQPGSETVAAADAVKDLQIGPIDGLGEFAVLPCDGAPVIDGSGLDRAEGGCDDLEIGISFYCAFDHGPETCGVELAQVGVDAFDFEAEASGEILFVSDHHVDIFGEFAIDFASAFDAADALPEAGPVIEIVTGYGSILFSAFERFDDDIGSGIGKSGEDSAGVEMADALFSEDLLPVDFAGLELRDGGIAAVGAAFGAAATEAAFDEVESVADGTADAVEGDPADVIGIDAALKDLEKRYSGEERGVRLIRYNDTYQFETNPAYGGTLSDILMETKERELK